MDSRQPVLSARGLRKEYGRGPALVRAVDEVSLDVAPGESVATVGPSGCGKSTLLYLLGGLERPTAGTLRLAQRRIEQMPEAGLARLRRHVLGFVFQAFHLVDELTALENVELPALLAGPPLGRPGSGPPSCWSRSGSKIAPSTFPRRCRADSASAWRSRVPSPTGRRSSSPTSQPGTSTARRQLRCFACSSDCTRTARHLSSSPTTSGSRRPPTA
jgi:ABC-type sugar transport system ATPase subunit